ncbi:hypothetical protein [Amycolatopsis sp.]|uniref:hypothetical protein n=1 Tax=Amycolatopsis sp. TaxID=37632 RepID=UPI002D808A0C|nr:hypothetical protein [Amycolatopsis sp.]
MSLRERKKVRTRETISGTAIESFIAKGFAQVSITEVADRIVGGTSVDDADAAAAAEQGFSLLVEGLGSVGLR